MDCLDIAFDTFKKSANRVEIFPKYHIYDTSEFNEFKNYIDKKPIEGFANQAWLDDISKWVGENKSILRLRIVPEIVSDYYLYESNWCYPRNIAAGETIKFVKENAYKELSQRYGINDDFWIFDDETVIILKYNEYFEFDKVIEVSSIEKDKYLLFFKELEKLAVG